MSLLIIMKSLKGTFTSAPGTLQGYKSGVQNFDIAKISDVIYWSANFPSVTPVQHYFPPCYPFYPFHPFSTAHPVTPFTHPPQSAGPPAQCFSAHHYPMTGAPSAHNAPGAARRTVVTSRTHGLSTPPAIFFSPSPLSPTRRRPALSRRFVPLTGHVWPHGGTGTGRRLTCRR